MRNSSVVPIALFLLTAATTFISGYMIGGTFAKGLLFSLSLLGILGAHEMGHYFYGKKYGISITAPWFIPAPPFLSPIGTFGAFIRIKSRIRTRKELFDVGVAGPIAGLLVALPVLFAGLLFSEVVPADSARLLEMRTAMSLGNSLVFALFSEITVGTIPRGHELIMHPVAFAGWIGLFVTALNLMPAGQLDGGHIVYSVFSSKWHATVSVATIVFLAAMGIGTAPVLELARNLGWDLFGYVPGWIVFEGWVGWFFWAILLCALGTSHPPTLLEDSGIGAARKTVAFFSLIIFICCISPVPLSIVEFG